MHSAGFAPLAYLKSRLIPVAALDIEDWDETIIQVGLGVAAKFDAYCNRGFELVEDAQDGFSASSLAVTLRRYPVQAVSAIELVDAAETALEIDVEVNLSKSSGVIEFQTPPGNRFQTLRITYTGGFWLDPQDATALPSGATALPYDILESYVAQCQAECEGRGIFHAMGLRDSKTAATPVTGLTDSTKEALNPYRRFSGA